MKTHCPLFKNYEEFQYNDNINMHPTKHGASPNCTCHMSIKFSLVSFSSLQSLSRVQLCNPMNKSTQASLSITNSQSSLQLMSTESVTPSSHLILCRPLRSDQISRSVIFDYLRPHELQHARLPCPSPTPGVHPDVHRVSDAIQPSHPLSSPSPPAPNPSQHQSLFQ